MISKGEVQKVLNENILSFWFHEMVDPKSGGFYGQMDGHGKVYTKSDKGVILNAQLLFTYSKAYQLTANHNHKWMAERAYEYLIKYFLDLRNGGVFWMLDHNSEVIDDSKQVFAQASAISALTEYHKINPYRRALDHSILIHGFLEKHGFDSRQNGYFEAFDRLWSSAEDVDDQVNRAKKLNTHLQLLDAYTNLYRIWPDAALRSQVLNLINLFGDKFLNANGHLTLDFDENWKLISDYHSFGHDLEGSWLLYEAALVMKDEQLIQEIGQTSLRVINAALEGLDKDGGFMQTAGANGLIDTDKSWWVQAEALIGLQNAWELSQNNVYLERLDAVWSFIKSHLIDVKGEWYSKVNQNGEVLNEENKAGPWKSPYHQSRALIAVLGSIA